MGLCRKEEKTKEAGGNLLENKPEQRALTKEEIDEENEGVPTDVGFSWVIVFTIFISNVLMNKVSVRTICVVASTFNAGVSVCLSLAPNIVVFLLLFGVKGFCFGTLLVGPISLIGFYFKKRRSFAMSIATAGMCVAFIVFPPVTEALRMQFGMRGSFLVIGAIELHVFACGLLLRPVESYKTVYKSRQRRKRLEEEQRIQLSPIYKGSGSNPTTDDGISHSKTDENTDDKVKDDQKLLHDVNDIYRNRSPSEVSYSTIHYEDGSSSVDISFTPGSSPVQFTSFKDDSSLSRSRENVDPKRRARKRNIDFQRQASNLSAISMTELPYVAREPVEEEDEQAENGLGKKQKRSVCARLLRTFIDFSLFKIWRFRMMAVFTVLSVFAHYTIIYMPVICSTIQISKPDAAMMMTVSGVMDLVTRIITGFIGDFKFMSKPKLVSFSLFVVGTICHCIRFFTTYTMFVVYAVLIGVFGGVRQNFFNIMLIEYVGVQKTAKAYGLASTLATLTVSVNHPIVAALFDATKGFVIPLHYIGSMVYLSAVLLAFEPVFRKLDVKRHADTNGTTKTTPNAGKLES